VFVTGYETPAADVPTTGTATFNGLAQGTVYVPLVQGSGGTLCNCGEAWITGNAGFTADFGARSLTGSLSGMTTPHPWQDGAFIAWNDVGFSSAIIGNRFSGTTWVLTVPSGYASLANNATGTLEGRFFGPAAREAGAVWTLFDGTNSAIGTLTGRRN
jgi:hypothetical protein